ncbi:hypothetical protein ACI2JA_20320 [Alkalihalobacillus sp. NPDC078783]
MLTLKYHVILIPLFFFCLCLIAGLDWIRTILYSAGIIIVAAISYHVQSGLWGEWASKRLRNTLLNSLFWVGIVIWIWLGGLSDSAWRLILATALIVLFVIFGIIDAYIWYKKEQREIQELEERNRKSDENV